MVLHNNMYKCAISIEAKQHHVQGKNCDESSFLQLCLHLVILPPILSAIIHLWLGSKQKWRAETSQKNITHKHGGE